MRSVQEIKDYCSWNNIPYKIIQSNSINENTEFDDLPTSIEQKIIIDTSNEIGGTKSGLFKFIKGE